MDFIQLLTSLPQSMMLWKLLSIFFGSLCFYLFPAAWSFWVNQKEVENNIEEIKNGLSILSKIDYLITDNIKINQELIELKTKFLEHNLKLESFIDKIELLISIKSNIAEEDDIFKVINKLHNKKRKIDRY